MKICILSTGINPVRDQNPYFLSSRTYFFFFFFRNRTGTGFELFVKVPVLEDYTFWLVSGMTELILSDWAPTHNNPTVQYIIYSNIYLCIYRFDRSDFKYFTRFWRLRFVIRLFSRFTNQTLIFCYHDNFVLKYNIQITSLKCRFLSRNSIRMNYPTVFFFDVFVRRLSVEKKQLVVEK